MNLLPPSPASLPRQFLAGALAGIAEIAGIAGIAGVAAIAATAAGAQAAALELVAVEPAALVAYAPATLVLRGAGFAAGAQVYIESGAVDRFVAFTPTVLVADRCEIALRLGFGPVPSQRRLYLRNPDGSRSAELRIRIDPAPARPVEVGPQVTPGNPDEPADRPSADAPSIRELRPEALPAGRPVELEILGTGFAAGAKVELTVNLHAGTSRMPEYGVRLFAAEWLAESELAVAFDRGFHSTPGVRNLVVVNPDGRRSEIAVVRILAGKEEL
jgi:hypothetical protein